MGATDVCPFLTVSWYKRWKRRRCSAENGRKNRLRTHGYPYSCYENAAFEEKRRNLADCRSGELRDWEKKLADPD
jgi:glutamate formiminotransferase/formiminotetrahydrofolate cyclodeaminase